VTNSSAFSCCKACSLSFLNLNSAIAAPYVRVARHARAQC
jgi:hypothetical protein